MTVQNVCKGICKIHNTFKVCRGCYRTRLEIAKWSSANDEEKLALIEDLQDREKLYGKLNT